MTNRICQAFYAVLLLLTILSTSYTAAATYYVDGQSPKAADSNPGTQQQPFKTIQKAATLAVAGDKVLIAPGVYHEQVEVENSGTAAQPIIFESTKWHGVLITGRDPDYAWLFKPRGNTQTGLFADYVTVRGVVFGDAVGPMPWTEKVVMGKGWRLEDCVVRGSDGGKYSADALVVMGSDTVILRTIAEDNSGNGMAGGANCKNILIEKSIIRRNNQLPMSLDYAGGSKFITTDGLTLDHCIIYDNFGAGFWLDGDNRNFTLSNNTVFGNHAGKWRAAPGLPAFYADPAGNVVHDDILGGCGIMTEISGGPGSIVGNVIYDNPIFAIHICESGWEGPITIEHNTLVGNGANVCFRAAIRNGTGGAHLGACIVRYNLNKDWGGVNDYPMSCHIAITTTTQTDTIAPFATPSDAGILIDYNTYDPPVRSFLWMKWESAAAIKAGIAYLKTFEELQDKGGVDLHGKIAHVAFKAPLFPIPETAPDDESLTGVEHLVPSQEAENTTIDGVLCDAAPGAKIVIPVFGRTQFVPVRPGLWACQVYDLQCRYVTLYLPSAALKGVIEAGVTDYALLQPTWLKVKLTKRESYNVEANFIGIVHR